MWGDSEKQQILVCEVFYDENLCLATMEILLYSYCLKHYNTRLNSLHVPTEQCLETAQQEPSLTKEKEWRSHLTAAGCLKPWLEAAKYKTFYPISLL